MWRRASQIACRPEIHYTQVSIGGHEGYITVGMFEDGSPGEIFITMANEGTTISGLMDSMAVSISLTLQYGVPLKFLVEKFSHVRFEPSGWTGNPQIPYAKSMMDYIFRWLGVKFLGPEYGVTEVGEDRTPRSTKTDLKQSLRLVPSVLDAPLCAECGSIMTQNGSCFKCGNCGARAVVVRISGREFTRGPLGRGHSNF